MKVGFRDTEGRRRRPDGRRVVYVWPFTDFDGHRNDLATARQLAWQWYVVRTAMWTSWYVGEAWDEHGERRFDMSSAPHPTWWEWVLWPLAAPGRWRRRHRRSDPEEEAGDDGV